MYRLLRSTFGVAFIGGVVLLSGCSTLPSSGPSRAQITREADSAVTSGIQIVDVTDDVARKLFAERSVGDFARSLGNSTSFQQQLGVGDTIEVSIWEAPPATLFGAEQLESKGGASNARVTVLPDQTIDGSGKISVPFAGEVKAAGRTPFELQRDIAAKLKNIAHDPQVLVKLSHNATSYVTVVGDVASSNRMALSARGERVLDALAAAGGVKQPVDKITLQITRGETVASLPLETVIRDPRQNVPLHAGDVVTALFQPLSFMSLGATGKNQEVNFEAQGITLAQAMARSGGLEDSRSDAMGVFVFRMENANALNWPNQPVRTTADGKVPVIYRVNLKDPNSFFVAQSFMMDNKDILYVSNAPVAELQKFLNVVFSVAYPIVYGVQTFR
ncbi:polysaccharide export protein [Paraburkholderia sp. Ac-20336]|uniref:polysaccharide biosynthesis/export family protein n=1 Tax=Burkholderiaceae TaxID=119060 RepID=UPI001420795A|nr:MULTISPECIES: polysaccharide biosynthesis/export family protein [Burkholderiaceae]MBN3804605.1 polysaccharide export protein [Paraburkholderia sp. Ac-20336]MBN3849911.1 polysaccharide export protein [Paraburkholderia sp. Ac-20342]NIF56129.1 polysaccharide export protein [Burkholderia sp. Ax-1724]